jgi:hypothetical protein
MAKGAEASAERVVKDIRRKTRRRFSAEEKIRIVQLPEESWESWRAGRGSKRSLRVNPTRRLRLLPLRFEDRSTRKK